MEHKSITEQKPQSIHFKDEIFVIGYMKNVCHLFGLTSFQFSVTGHKLTLVAAVELRVISDHRGGSEVGQWA